MQNILNDEALKTLIVYGSFVERAVHLQLSKSLPVTILIPLDLD